MFKFIINIFILKNKNILLRYGYKFFKRSYSKFQKTEEY